MSMNRSPNETTSRRLLLGVAVSAAVALSLAGCGKQEEAAQAAPPPVPVAATTIGTEIDDAVLTTKVKTALLGDPEIRSFDLNVETRKGEVQLTGFVNNQAQIDLAIGVVRGIEGVTGVQNGISIKDGATTIGTTVDDSIITAGVKSALLADPGMKSFDIAVVTRKGEVQLSGFVDSRAQIDQAVAIAGKVSGVTQVGNEMRIKQ